MTDPWLGLRVRDTVSGVSGMVVGCVEWLHNPQTTLIVQPPVRDDGTVPPTVYVPKSAAEPMGPVPSERPQ